MPPYASRVSYLQVDEEREHDASEFYADPMLRVSGAEAVFRNMHIMEVVRLMDDDKGEMGKLARDFLYRVCRESTIRNGLYENAVTLKPHTGLEFILIRLGSIISDLTVDYTNCSIIQIRNVASLVSSHCRTLMHYRVCLNNKTSRHATSAYNIPTLTFCRSIHVQELPNIGAPSTKCFEFNNDRLVSRLIVSAPNLIELNLQDLAVHGWFLSCLSQRIRRLKMINLKKFTGSKKINFSLRHIGRTTTALNVDKLTMELPEITHADIGSVLLCAKKLHLRITDIDSDLMNRMLKDIINTNHVSELRLGGANMDLEISEETAASFRHFTKLRWLYVDKSFLNANSMFYRVGLAPHLKRVSCDFWTGFDPKEYANNVTILFRCNPQVRAIELDFVPAITNHTADMVLERLVEVSPPTVLIRMQEYRLHRSIVMERFTEFNARRNRIRNSARHLGSINRINVGVRLQGIDVNDPGQMNRVNGAQLRNQPRTNVEAAHNLNRADQRNEDVDSGHNSSTSSGNDVAHSELNPEAQPYRPPNSNFRYP